MPLNLRNSSGPWYESRQWKRILARLPKRVSSAALQLETDDGRILIVKAHYKAHWSLPSGVVDPGETPLEAVVRETSEEVGLTIPPENVSFVRIVTRHSRSADTYQFVFKAPLRDEQIEQIKLQASEIGAYRLVTKQDVLSKDIDYGKVITDWANGTTGYVEHTFGR